MTAQDRAVAKRATRCMRNRAIALRLAHPEAWAAMRRWRGMKGSGVVVWPWSVSPFDLAGVRPTQRGGA